jgi:ABC-2 type transport system permease protein
MGSDNWLGRIGDELAQAWAIAVKDVRAYYLTPTTVLWALLMPFAMWSCFVVREGMTAEFGLARLLAIITFFTTSSVGPVIILLERRMRTYDRLLVAPMSLSTVIVGKSLVGVFFGLAVSLLPLISGLTVFRVSVASPLLLAIGLLLSSSVFAALGTLFASGSAQMPCQVLIPTMLLRWPLLFVSGVLIPLEQLSPWVRALSYLSPLTYAQDLLNHAVVGSSSQDEVAVWLCGLQLCRATTPAGLRGGVQSPLLDLVMLLCLMVLFLIPSLMLHHRSRRLGY